jgi:predicted nucleotide-binding protein (sugar kinase/HSP70/actin superfamily)
LTWRGCVAYELLGKLLREIRPYEVNAGETDGVYDVCKQDLYATLVRSGDAVEALERARAAFERVPVDRSVVRPRIGIVGEVFVRMHEYSNGHIVRKIETLGGEACLPGFQEWMYHCNYCLRRYALARGKCRLLAQVWVQDRLQKSEEKRALAALRSLLVGVEEPETRQLWENAGTYFLPWFGEASLGLGKAVEYARAGVSGIVNLMPFTCLIGSICKTQLQPFRRDYGQIPVLNLEYDGLEESAFMDDLEPFMDQARDYLDRHRAAGASAPVCAV